MINVTLKNDANGRTFVLGRSLFKFISGYRNDTDFTKWAKTQIDQFVLAEGVDYVKYKEQLSGDRTKNIQIDFTLDVAVRMAKKKKMPDVVEHLLELKSQIEQQPQINTPAIDTESRDFKGTSDMAISDAQVLEPQGSGSLEQKSDSIFPALASAYTRDYSRPSGEVHPTTPITLSESELNLSPAQLLMKRAQELLDEENRLKSDQENRARKAAEQPAELSPQYEARLKSLEGKTDTLLHFFQQAASVLRGFESVGSPNEADVCPAAEEAAEPVISPMRAELVQLVNAWAAATEKTEHAVWKYLYGNFSLRSKSRFNPYPYGAAVKDKNYLSIMEKQGHLEELYQLAKSLFVLPAIKA